MIQHTFLCLHHNCRCETEVQPRLRNRGGERAQSSKSRAPSVPASESLG
jgi:hypothetical protein